jgi:hypothetical protein
MRRYVKKTFKFAFNMKKYLGSVILILLIIVAFVGDMGCASIVPPSGGTKDTLSPVVTQVSPPDRSTFFKDRKITFSFNEYVELNDAYKNLIISPVPKNFPEIQRKLRSITIRLKDTLIPNTTYVFNFKKAVKDVNEGNMIKDLIYVVSTGAYLDSLELSGNIKIAKTNKPDSTLTIMLHSNLDDSAVVKEKPKYITKTDSSGNFLFRFLSPGKYRLYALKDEGGSYLYNSKEQVFAFANQPVVISNAPPEPIRLYAYSIEEAKKDEASEPEEKKEKVKRLKVTTNIQSKEQDLLDSLVLTFEKPLKVFDTTKMKLYTDSSYKAATGYSFKIDSTRKTVTMNMAWQEAKPYHLILEKDFASDSANVQLLKKDTITFTTKSKKQYGQVKITFNNLDMSINPVLQILQGGTVKNSFPLTSPKIEIQLYLPGEYDLQILHDTNKNNKWDPGEFFKTHRQPEMITPISRKLNVKADWETEFEITLK